VRVLEAVPQRARVEHAAPPGGAFVLLRFDGVEVPTGIMAQTPDELMEALSNSDRITWFHHLIEEAWLRPGPIPIVEWLRAAGSARLADILEREAASGRSVDQVRARTLQRCRCAGCRGASGPPNRGEGSPVTHVMISTDGPSLAEGYRSIAGPESLHILEGLVRRLRGHRLVMVNSTSTGGGVAEILHRLVRLLNELGLPTVWEVMPGDARFYAITKSIHNALHGAPATLTASDWEHFDEVNREGARRLALDGDLIMIHDPQPVGLAALRRRPGQTWVCVGRDLGARQELRQRRVLASRVRPRAAGALLPGAALDRPPVRQEPRARTW